MRIYLPSMWISWIQKNVRTPESVKIGPGEKSPGKSPRNIFWIDSTSLCTSISEKLKSGGKTGAFSSSLPIICRFSISGALPQLFYPFTFLGHCPSFSALLHFWGIAPAFPYSSISGALPQLFRTLPFLGHFNSCQKI